MKGKGFKTLKMAVKIKKRITLHNVQMMVNIKDCSAMMQLAIVGVLMKMAR